MMMKKNFLGFISLILIIACNGRAQEVPAIIPDFTFYDVKDNSPFTKRNIDKSAKTVFLFFNSECHHCQDEVKAIGENFDAFRQVKLYMVSVEEKGKIEGFMERYGKKVKDQANVRVLQDPKHEFVTKFLPKKYPAFYVYSPSGNLLNYYNGETKIKELISAVQ